jgi:hypothetical protein
VKVAKSRPSRKPSVGAAQRTAQQAEGHSRGFFITPGQLANWIVVIAWGSFLVGAHWGATSPTMDVSAASQMIATSMVAIVFASAFMGKVIARRGQTWFYIVSFTLLLTIVNSAVAGVMQISSPPFDRAMVGGSLSSSLVLALGAGLLAALERARA